MIRVTSRFAYPQRLFGRSIARALRRYPQITTIIDAPCGRGEATYHLAKRSGRRVRGYDLSEESVRRARLLCPGSNVRFEVKEIHQVVRDCRGIECFCLINSLFLLPDPDGLIAEIAEKLTPNGLLCVIVPNTESLNYRTYRRGHPDVNLLELDRGEFREYFESKGLRVEETRGIVRTRLYGGWRARLPRPARNVYLTALNGVRSSLGLGEPCYYLLLLRRR